VAKKKEGLAGEGTNTLGVMAVFCPMTDWIFVLLTDSRRFVKSKGIDGAICM